MTPPSSTKGARLPAVFTVGLKRMLLARRTVLLVLLGLLPAGLTLATVALRLLAGPGGDLPPPADLLDVQAGFFLRIALPLAALLYGGAVIADEVDAGTFVYVWARPVPRWVLVTGRTLAAAVAAWAVTTLGILALAGASIPAGMRAALLAKIPLAVVAVAAAAPAYAALFGAFGSWFRRPLMAGLVWILAWEMLIGAMPGTIRHLTFSQHSRSLFPYLKQDTGFWAAEFVATPAWLAVAVLLAAAVVLMVLHTVWLHFFELRLQGGED